jgi:hypothetical protein
VNVANDLRAALENKQFLDENLPRIRAEIHALAGEKAAEKRFEGTIKEGLYFKSDRGRVAATAGQTLVAKFDFLWRVPPPSGKEVRFSGGPTQDDRAPFYACSRVLFLTKRFFVFPPAKCELLADQDVSWFYQVPLAQLSESEAEKERAYRASLGLHFPLTKLPE